jgi:predicted nuclease of predicted toxin-antitoxin system
MKVLLDECVPRVVKNRLPAHDIRTVQEMGWAGTKNGELLTLAETQFEVFVTTDKNLRHQQNLSQRKLAFVLLPSNQVPVVESIIHNIEDALEFIKAGDFVVILPPDKQGGQ